MAAGGPENNSEFDSEFDPNHPNEQSWRARDEPSAGQPEQQPQHGAISGADVRGRPLGDRDPHGDAVTHDQQHWSQGAPGQYGQAQTGPGETPAEQTPAAGGTWAYPPQSGDAFQQQSIQAPEPTTGFPPPTPPGSAQAGGYAGPDQPGVPGAETQQIPTANPHAAPGQYAAPDQDGQYPAPDPYETFAQAQQAGPESEQTHDATQAYGQYPHTQTGQYPQPGANAHAGYGYAPAAADAGAGPPAWQPQQSKSGGTKRVVWIVAAAVLAVIVIGGGVLGVRSLFGSGIETADGTIDNAEEFLTQVSNDWNSSLTSDHLTLSENPQCYYVLDAEGLATGDLACGGVRRVNVDDGATWDVWEFTAWEDPDGTITAADPEPVEMSVTRPEGTLVDAQGNEAPQDVGQLEAPPLPQAEAGLVISDLSPGLTLTDKVQPGEAGTVITPAGVLQIDSIATAETLRADVVPDMANTDAAARAYRAADGEKFRVVEFSFDPSEAEVAAALSLTYDGQQKQIAQLAEGSRGWGGSGAASYRILVSVPADGGAQLVVSSDGHDQVVDLASGDRADDPIAATYYRDVTQQDINAALTLGEKQIDVENSDDPLEVSGQLAIGSVSLTPYSPSEGWADEGKAWLIVNYTTSTEGFTWSTYRPAAIDITWSMSSGGQESEASTSVEADYGNTDGVASIPVPADTSKVSISPTVEITLEASSQPTKHPSWTPDTVSVEFPK